MYTTKKIAYRRYAFTLVEMLVVIAIILALAALAAAFAPRVSDNQRMTRAVDSLEQWLLTAKMRAKRDGLSTGLRFIQAPGDISTVPGPAYSQFQYIQQPPPLAGGTCVGGPPFTMPPLPGVYQYPAGIGNYYTGGLLISATTSGLVTFAPGSVDFTLGGLPLTSPNQLLVQPGDFLEINGGGVFYIAAVISSTSLQLAGTATYFINLTIPATGTTNYRIIRQPRILIGEEPLTLPNNYAVNFSAIPGSGSLLPGCNVQPRIVTITPPVQYYEILFSPTGAVIGSNAGNSTVVISVWDTTMDTTLPDFASRVGIVGVQTRSGFIGAYEVSLSGNPFYFVQLARESGM